MKQKYNTKKILRNVQVSKKKLKQSKSQLSVAHPTSKQDDYYGNNDNNEELVDYREPEWDGVTLTLETLTVTFAPVGPQLVDTAKTRNHNNPN